MNKQQLVKRFAISTVSLLGLLLSNSIVSADPGNAGGRRANEVGSMGPVPKAECGRSDRIETGLQGQTTSLERSSGDSEDGYNCNLELVGQFQGEGAFSQNGPAYFDHCAYMSTENNPRQAHPWRRGDRCFGSHRIRGRPRTSTTRRRGSTRTKI
jgi:hypothetical protein